MALRHKPLRYFWWHALGCTLFVHLVLGLLLWLPVQLEGLNPVSKALQDFQFTDVIYSQLRDPAPADTSIVLVNIGELPTAEMATLVHTIAAEKPLLVGIDAIYNNPVRDTAADALLEAAFAQVPNLVLACKADAYNDASQRFDSLHRPIPRFAQHAALGFANFITEEREYGNTSRTFTPQCRLKNGDTLLALAVEMAHRVYPGQTANFLRNAGAVETIDFSRTETGYYLLDWHQVLDPERTINLQGKVVLMGYMGRYLGDPSILDKFFTPMNPQYAGRSIPDMFGVVVHANILSQIKEQRRINPWPEAVGLLLGFLLVYINVFGFYLIYARIPAYYDLLTKSIQFAESLLILFLVVALFFFYEQDLDLSIGIAALVLSGDLLEIYAGALPALSRWITNISRVFSRPLKTEKPDTTH